VSQWRRDNPEKAREVSHNWATTHRDEAKRAAKEWREQNPERELDGKRRWYRENWIRLTLKAALKRAERKGIEFTITEADIQPPPLCPVFGIPLVVGEGRVGFGHDNSPTVDRIDDTKGYVPGNVAVISMKANVLKGRGTAEEHEAIARWMRASG
jgi:hypothetical protein